MISIVGVTRKAKLGQMDLCRNHAFAVLLFAFAVHSPRPYSPKTHEAVLKGNPNLPRFVSNMKLLLGYFDVSYS